MKKLEMSEVEQYWQQTGFVSHKRWMTVNDQWVCPICAFFFGRTAEIGKPFHVPMAALPRELQEKLTFDDLEYMGPPAHEGCRCYMQPVVSREALREQVRAILRGTGDGS